MSKWASENLTIEDLQVNSTNLNWYDNETDITPLRSADALIDGEDYWATQSNATGCENSTIMIVDVILTAPETPTIITTGSEFCVIDNSTVSDLNDRVSTSNNNKLTWYEAYPNCSLVSLSEPFAEGQTYSINLTKKDVHLQTN